MRSYFKEQTFRCRRWLQAAATLDCVRCGAHGTQAAHRNEGKGMALKTDDCLVAALCPTCHMEIDQGKNMDKEERHREMDRAILETLKRLVRAGLVGVK